MGRRYGGDSAGAEPPPVSAATGEAIPPDILDEAIAWVVRLGSGTANAADRRACETWRAADPRHERAWQALREAESPFRELPAMPAHVAYRTLEAAGRKPGMNRGRRRALQLLGLGGLAIATGLLARRVPWEQRETFRTAVGERRAVHLADGTRLMLNTASEAEAVFSPLRRLILLRRGEIHVETGADTASATGRRPFWVETATARLEAIGTRFAVLDAGGSTRLHVAEGAVAMHTGPGFYEIARAGDTFLIGGADIPAIRRAAPALAPDTWTEGVLIAKQMRLDDFAAELARYRRAPLRCTPEAAPLRVSGVFQLDGRDPADRALAALARTLPVAIARGPGETLTIRRK